MAIRVVEDIKNALLIVEELERAGGIYKFYRYRSTFHVSGFNSANSTEFMKVLPMLSKLKDIPQVGEPIGNTPDGAIEPIYIHRHEVAIKDFNNCAITVTGDNDVFYPDYSWQFSNVRSFVRQTYVDVLGKAIYVARPFEPTNNNDRPPIFKAAACDQILHQQQATRTLFTTKEEFLKMKAQEGTINNKPYLNQPIGGWLCVSVVASTATGLSKFVRDNPDNAFRVDVSILSAGPIGPLTKILGSPTLTRNAGKKNSDVKIENNIKRPWDGLAYYVSPYDSAINLPKHRIKTKKNDGDNENYSTACQEIIVPLYDDTDFNNLGPDNWGFEK